MAPGFMLELAIPFGRQLILESNKCRSPQGISAHKSTTTSLPQREKEKEKEKEKENERKRKRRREGEREREKEG